VIDGTEHRIYGHQGTTYSVFRSRSQIGLIDREAKSVAEGGKYHADFDNNLDPLLCACLVLFVDASWHMDDNLEFGGVRYEWNLQVGGVSRDPNWQPSGEARDHGGITVAPAVQSFHRAASVAPKPLLKLLGWVFAVLSAGLLIACLVLFLRTRDFVAVADRTDGVVTKLLAERGDKGSTLYRAVFEYRDLNQRTHEVRSSLASNPPAHRVGDRVNIMYRAADPDGAVIDGFSDLWLPTAITGSIGAIFSVVATMLLLLGYLK
jgi:hypothetical protein